MVLSFVEVASITDETVLWRPLENWQRLRHNGLEVGPSADGLIRVYGSGVIEASEGFWLARGRFAGRYDGPLFEGSSKDQVTRDDLGGGRFGCILHNVDGDSITITAPAGTGQYRLTEGAHTGFRTGDGVPKVHVKDPDRTLQMISDNGALSDYQITLEEIG
ncbi:hypothetical protein [Timonella senegalensis]|uniref:hypothetical protein n=1 Tax=Timonella senegalensis TaxID=1465825 RepID=UPI002FDD758C